MVTIMKIVTRDLFFDIINKFKKKSNWEWAFPECIHSMLKKQTAGYCTICTKNKTYMWSFPFKWTRGCPAKEDGGIFSVELRVLK